MDGNYSLADIAAATGNGRNNDGMFGGDGSWWIIVLFIFAFFGWGNNGWGNNGNGGGYAATAATQADIQRGFDNSAVISKLDELTTEMSDMSKDAECREERDLVKRYVEKLRDML